MGRMAETKLAGLGKKKASQQANAQAAEYYGNSCDLYLRASKDENKSPGLFAVAYSGQGRKGAC